MKNDYLKNQLDLHGQVELAKAVMFWFGDDTHVNTLIIAQAYHESDGLRSNIYKENKNPFGMKLPQRRLTYAYTEERGHARYHTVGDAVGDLWLWLQFHSIDVAEMKDITDYADTLKKRGYYEDSQRNYANGMKHWSKYVKLWFSSGERQ